MNNDKLDQLQKEFLTEFFKRESHFFLSGGAALAGYYLGHRKTEDIDLFTVENEMERGVAIVREVALRMDGEIESIQTSPDFRRLLLRRGPDAIVVDLIHEVVYQINNEKREMDGIRIDSPEEILANKLCTLLSRSEIRDLVDVRALDLAGYSVETALTEAAKKDSGLTPGQLAWVLNQIHFGDDSVPPGGVSLADLRTYLAGLLTRLTQIAFVDQ